MSITKIIFKANKRNICGTSSSKSLRKNGRIPAIIYRKDIKPISISIELKEIDKYYKQPGFMSSVMEIDLEGEKYNVLVQDYQLDLIKDQPIHVDFIILGKDRHIAKIPVKYMNRLTAQGVKRGGFFNIIKRKVALDCPVNSIPKAIEIDVIQMRIGQSLKAKQLVMPENVTLAENENLIIASVSGRGKDKEESKEEVTEESKAVSA